LISRNSLCDQGKIIATLANGFVSQKIIDRIFTTDLRVTVLCPQGPCAPLVPRSHQSKDTR
jgi:hypothetical protein